jgi:two-component system, NarL family, invasion response regulator UvrY
MNLQKKYKLIIADDHILLRDALANLINTFDEFTVVASASNGQQVLNFLDDKLEADIVLMDLNMPEMDGYDTAKLLQKKYPQIKILILTMYDGEMVLIRLLQTGVNGFLKKDIHPTELNRALKLVAEGEFYYSNHITHKIATLFKKSYDSHSTIEKSILTDTEIDFLKLASTDLTYKEIAFKMHLTPRLIDSYPDNLFEKLDVKSRVGLAIYAIKNGIVSF